MKNLHAPFGHVSHIIILKSNYVTDMAKWGYTHPLNAGIFSYDVPASRNRQVGFGLNATRSWVVGNIETDVSLSIFSQDK